MSLHLCKVHPYFIFIDSCFVLIWYFTSGFRKFHPLHLCVPCLCDWGPQPYCYHLLSITSHVNGVQFSFSCTFLSRLDFSDFCVSFTKKPVDCLDFILLCSIASILFYFSPKTSTLLWFAVGTLPCFSSPWWRDCFYWNFWVRHQFLEVWLVKG